MAEPAAPAWFADLLGAVLPAEGGAIELRGQSLTMTGGILRAREEGTTLLLIKHPAWPN